MEKAIESTEVFNEEELRLLNEVVYGCIQTKEHEIQFKREIDPEREEMETTISACWKLLRAIERAQGITQES